MIEILKGSRTTGWGIFWIFELGDLGIKRSFDLGIKEFKDQVNWIFGDWGMVWFGS